MFKNFKRKLFSLFLTALISMVMLAPAGVLADSDTINYKYLIGTVPLCGFDPTACPDISVSSNDDTIEITGEGTFSIHPKSVTGGGAFVHKNSDGDVLGSGTWEAVRLLTFRSYGSGAAQGLPSEFEGGKALMRVHLTPDSDGPGFDAILWVDCTLGDKIPTSAKEGIRLAVRGAPNFNKEVSGFTLFIRE